MPAKHSWLEDMLAMLTATGLISLGIVFFNQPGLVVGGTAGLALLLHKLLPLSFGQLFFMLNVPFYWLAWKRLGGQFVVKTLLSVTAVSFFGDHLHQWMQINEVRPIYAALMGSVLVGVGLLILFRHRAVWGALILSASGCKSVMALVRAKYRWVSIALSFFLRLLLLRGQYW
jgi:uncharacterized membrane-anchored protein YitT (DUF2179 family)